MKGIMNTKILKNDCYFVLYTKDDITLCLYEDYKELSKYINLPARKLAFRFKQQNPITITIMNVEFHLCYFLKDIFE